MLGAGHLREMEKLMRQRGQALPSTLGGEIGGGRSLAAGNRCWRGAGWAARSQRCIWRVQGRGLGTFPGAFGRGAGWLGRRRWPGLWRCPLSSAQAEPRGGSMKSRAQWDMSLCHLPEGRRQTERRRNREDAPSVRSLPLASFAGVVITRSTRRIPKSPELEMPRSTANRRTLLSQHPDRLLTREHQPRKPHPRWRSGNSDNHTQERAGAWREDVRNVRRLQLQVGGDAGLSRPAESPLERSLREGRRPRTLFWEGGARLGCPQLPGRKS